MNLKVIYHRNYIGHEINESLKNRGKKDREIYCKKLHKITEPMESDCSDCPYYAGTMLGHGIECAWTDVAPESGDTVEVRHSEVQKEFIRVSRLIDQGTVKKG